MEIADDGAKKLFILKIIWANAMLRGIKDFVGSLG